MIYNLFLHMHASEVYRLRVVWDLFKASSHDAIATAIFLSPQMCCMGFNKSVDMVRLLK